MALCFVQLKQFEMGLFIKNKRRGRKKINHHIVEGINRILHHIEGGTRESHPSVQDLQSTTRLAESWMLKIVDTRMGFPSPSLNVVIDYLSHSCLKMCKICLKCTLDATFSRLFGVDVL